MGKITILPETTKNPITLMGQMAGVCWGADITDDKKNYKRGLDCIKSQHGRVLEYVNVEIVIEGYSARVIREWYTHIGCLPTRLQASTRYIDYSNFNYIVPNSIKNNKDNRAWEIYANVMKTIRNGCKELEVLGIPREDIAMILPMGMETKVVDKRNLRNYIDMSHQRMCTRAYWEYRMLFHNILNELSKISDEWKWIVDNCFKKKCEMSGYCPEKNSCGFMPREE